MKLRGRAVIAVLAATLAGGCEDSQTKQQPSIEERIVEAWKQAGLEVPAFAPVAGAGIGGGTCRSGTVSKIHATLCRYTDAATASAARKSGLTHVGETTGVAVASDNRLLMLADRDQVDPSGKTINQITKIFLATREPAQPASGDKPASR